MLNYPPSVAQSSKLETSGPVLDRRHHCCIHEWQAGEAPRQCNSPSHGHGSSPWHGWPTWHEAYGSSNGGTNGHAAWRSNGHASRNAPSYGNASLWRSRHATGDGRTSWNGRASWNGGTTRDGWTSWDAGTVAYMLLVNTSTG